MMDVRSIKRMVRLSGTLAACTGALLLAACATTPVIHTRTAEGANLAQSHTFAFVHHPGTDHGPYKSLTTQRLEHDVTQQMRSRGYSLVSTNADPDLLIDFRLTTHNRVRGGMGPAFMGGYWGDWDDGWGPYGWGGWGPYGWGWGWYNGVQTVTSSDLTVSVIDRADRSVLWSGTASYDVTEHSMYHPGKNLDEAVTQIFAHYPVPVGTRGTGH